MDSTGVFIPIVVIALVIAVVVVVIAVLASRKKRSFPGNQQPYQNQYPQYPGTAQNSVPQTGGPQTGGPQTGGPQSGGPVPGAPQFNGPGFPQKPQRPGWVIPLIVVAVAAVVLCCVLGGILIGQRLGVNSGSVEKVTPEPVPTEAPAPSLPETSSAPEQASQPAGGTAQSQPAESSQAGPASEPALSPKADFPQTGKLWTLGDCLDEAIDWIEDSPNYMENYAFEPLGAVDDMDGDGYEDFIAAYECQAKNGTVYVAYCVFTFPEDGPKLVTDGVLFQEVGGNSGSVGVAYGKDGAPYLTLFTSVPTGDTMDKFYQFIPWKNLGQWENNGAFMWEARWTVGEESSGTYLLGSDQVDKAQFDKSLANYEQRYAVNILAGHGNGDVGGVDFDTLEKWYDD